MPAKRSRGLRSALLIPDTRKSTTKYMAEAKNDAENWFWNKLSEIHEKAKAMISQHLLKLSRK
jgi:hypothetical protein